MKIYVEGLSSQHILPLKFEDVFTRNKLNLNGSELFSIIEIEKGINPRDKVECEIKFKDGSIKKIKLLARIDTDNELEYYKNDGILQFVLRNMI